MKENLANISFFHFVACVSVNTLNLFKNLKNLQFMIFVINRVSKNHIIQLLEKPLDVTGSILKLTVEHFTLLNRWVHEPDEQSNFYEAKKF